MELFTKKMITLGMPAEEEGAVLDFMKVFLIATKEQRLAILRNITKKQCGQIRQVAYNILFNDSLDISADEREYLKRHHTAIKKLASGRVSLDTKKRILVRKQLLVKRLAEIAVNYLL